MKYVQELTTPPQHLPQEDQETGNDDNRYCHCLKYSWTWYFWLWLVISQLLRLLFLWFYTEKMKRFREDTCFSVRTPASSWWKSLEYDDHWVLILTFETLSIALQHHWLTNVHILMIATDCILAPSNKNIVEKSPGYMSSSPGSAVDKCWIRAGDFSYVRHLGVTS